MIFFCNRWRREVLANLKQLTQQGVKMSQGIDDLNASVTSLETQVAAQTTSINNSVAAQELILQEIQTLKANGGLSDADAEKLAVRVQAGITALQGSQAALDAETTKDGQN